MSLNKKFVNFTEKDFYRILEENRLRDPSIEFLEMMKYFVTTHNTDMLQKLYHTSYVYCLEYIDRDDFYSNYINWFNNMKIYDSQHEKREPITSNHYVCIRHFYYKGEPEEYYIDTFFKKKEFFENPFFYNQLIMLNNMINAETYMHIYEFSRPELTEENFIQCNNMVFHFKWQGTKREQFLNKSSFDIACNTEMQKILQEAGLPLRIRHLVSDGQIATITIDLDKSLNMRNKNLRYVYEKTEKTIIKKLAYYGCVDLGHFFRLPGSINTQYTTEFEMQDFRWYHKRVYSLNDNHVLFGNSCVRRCYLTGGKQYIMDKDISFSEIANMVGIPIIDKGRFISAEHKKNYICFHKVGIQRLMDFDLYLKYRNYKPENSFQYLTMLANILFFLGKEENEVFQYIKKVNEELMNSVSNIQLNKILESQKKNYTLYLTNTKLGYKYSNTAIVRKLKVKDWEQYNMYQIIDTEEKKYRAKECKRIYAENKYHPIKEANKKKQEEKIKELELLKKQGFSNKEIATIKHLDIRTVNKKIGKQKQELSSEIIQEIVYKYSHGYTMVLLCKEYGLSRSKMRIVLKNSPT